MNNDNCATPQHMSDHSIMCHFKRVSWTAIIVGALVGIGLSFLLNLFSVAIGLSIVTTTNEGIMTLAMGGLVGLLIGTIISMFIAGYTAGYLGRPYCVKQNLGVVYGFTTWCLALILTVMLTTRIGYYVAAYSNFIKNPTDIVVVTNHHLPNGNAVEAVDNNNNTNTVAVNAQKATNNLGMSTLIVFILFFVGALASCFGGHFGMCCKKDCVSTPERDRFDRTDRDRRDRLNNNL
jgi:hypothetical protein